MTVSTYTGKAQRWSVRQHTKVEGRKKAQTTLIAGNDMRSVLYMCVSPQTDTLA